MIVVCVAFRSCKSVILNDFTKSHLIDSVPVLTRLEETVGKITLTSLDLVYGLRGANVVGVIVTYKY